MITAKLNLTALINGDGAGSLPIHCVKKTNGIEVIINSHVSSDSLEVSESKSQSFVYDGTPAQIKTKVAELGLEDYFLVAEA